MSQHEILNHIKWLSSEEIVQLAYDSGFQKRRSGKIRSVDFFKYFCLESIKGTVSYNDLAAKIQAQTGCNASRQAYHQRMGPDCVAFFVKALAHLMSWKSGSQKNGSVFTNSSYTRILVQDSTVVRLPTRLFDTFSGVKNAHSSVCNARIQCVYDLVSQEFIHFSIDSYSKNDVSVTHDIPVQPGDLTLRDRGYFNLDVMAKQKQEQNSDSIFRYKHKCTFYIPETGHEIDLLQYLTTHGSIDKVVLAGKGKKYRLRLIAFATPEEVANIRRMKAKKESKGKNPSTELLKLMSWNIFVITMTDKTIAPSFIAQIYGLRWRIENIFKTWKSNFNFDHIHNVSKNQLSVLLRARLVIITMSYHVLYRPLSRLVNDHSSKTLSLMKLTRYISRNSDVLERLINAEQVLMKDFNALVRYCTYDSRKRKTFVDQLLHVVEKLDRQSIVA